MSLLIFCYYKQFEEKFRTAEDDILNEKIGENRTKLDYVLAEYIKFLKLEQSILKQKSLLQWFWEGDVNSKYFKANIQGRKRRLFIHKISDNHGNCIERDEINARASCSQFEGILQVKINW